MRKPMRKMRITPPWRGYTASQIIERARDAAADLFGFFLLAALIIAVVTIFYELVFGTPIGGN